jgi:hypothetical protein
MPTKQKKIFIAIPQPEGGQSLFFRLWSFMNNDQLSVRQEAEFEPGLAKVAEEIDRWQHQMQRQQAHIDEIKRLCHVPVR